MLRRLLFAAILAFAPLGVPASAQPAATAQESEAATAFFAWMQPVSALIGQAGQTMQPFLRLDYNAANREEALVIMRTISRDAIAARTQLATISAQIDAIPAFTHRHATANMLSMSELILADSRTSIANLSQLLEDIIAFAAAVERGDSTEVARLEPQLERGAMLLVRANATTLRTRQAMVGEGGSTYHLLGGMALMYDGMAMLMIDDAAFDVAALEATADRLNDTIALQRRAVASERAALAPSHPHYPIGAQIMTVRDGLVAANERARDILRSGVGEARAGGSTLDSRLEFVRQLGELEFEYQALTNRQIDLLRQLPQ